MRRAVQAHIRDALEPTLTLLIQIGIVQKGAAVDEIAAHVADGAFDFALRLGTIRAACAWHEAPVVREAEKLGACVWNVDTLTILWAELMQTFYRGMLKQHLSPAAALRAAQLQMSRDPRWASPYFWAGFVMQGDWK